MYKSCSENMIFDCIDICSIDLCEYVNDGNEKKYIFMREIWVSHDIE